MVEQRASKFLTELAPFEAEVSNPQDYFLIAKSGREHYKATFDMLYEVDDL